jgi:hypothetical protein
LAAKQLLDELPDLLTTRITFCRDELLLCQRQWGDQGLRWGFAVAPPTLMWALGIIFRDPSIEIGLQLIV